MTPPPNDHRLRGRTFVPIGLLTAGRWRQEMPCHRAHGVAFLEHVDAYGPRQCWEQACPICGQTYRYENRRITKGQHVGTRCIWWYAIDSLTDPTHPPKEPLDYWLVLQREQAA